MDWNVSASAADSDGFLLHLARLAIFDGLGFAGFHVNMYWTTIGIGYFLL